MILTAGPSITQKEIDYVNDAKSGWNDNWNSYLPKLEESFKEKFNAKHALLTSSCTGARNNWAIGIKEDKSLFLSSLACYRVQTILAQHQFLLMLIRKHGLSILNHSKTYNKN